MFCCCHVQLFATPWTLTFQAPLFMEFPKQKYWNVLPFPSPGHLPDPGIEPISPAWQADFSLLDYQESPNRKQHNDHSSKEWINKTCSVQSVGSVTQSCLTLRPHELQHLSITNSWSLLKITTIESVMPSNHLILCHLLLHPSSIFPSIRVFSKESAVHIRWPKYWSFSFGISPSNEYSELISFRMDWLYLLAVQETLKSLLQHHSSKASILHRSAFFMVQLSHPYRTTG